MINVLFWAVFLLLFLFTSFLSKDAELLQSKPIGTMLKPF